MITMKSTPSFLFLLHAIINIVINLAMAKPITVQTIYRCRPAGKYTNIAYKSNIEAALNAVATNIGAHKGFFHATAGKTDPVNAVGLCPPYVKPDICAACVKKSVQALVFNCPDDKEAVTWATNCMLRYSDRKILGVLDSWVVAIDASGTKVVMVREMDNGLTDLTNRLLKQGAGGSAVEKYAYGNLTYVQGQPATCTLYVALQCTPDLSKEDCSKCLLAELITIHPCCSGKVSGRLLAPNCYLRYEHEKFDEA